MDDNARIKQIQKELEKTTTTSSKIDDKLYKAFENGTTKDLDLDFIKTMISSLKTTYKSASIEILTYRVATNRLR